MGKTLVLHELDLGSMPGVSYGLLNLPGVIPECRVRNKPETLPQTNKQTKTTIRIIVRCQRDSIAGKVPILHAAGPCSIPTLNIVPQILPGVIPDLRSMSKP